MLLLHSMRAHVARLLFHPDLLVAALVAGELGP